MKVYIDVHDKRWNKYKIDFEKIVCTADSGVCSDSEVSIVLTNDDEIHDINKKYRNVDKPTNVLSFELGDDILLGDIYISFDTVMREAKQAKIPFKEHVAHMVVHGMFHLLGYDHITDDEAVIMEMKEGQALKKIGIKNPYADDNDFVCADGSCCPGNKIFAFLHRIKIRDNSFWQYALYALFGGLASFGFAPFYCWWVTVVGVGGAYWLTVRNQNNGGVSKTFLRVMPFGAMYGVSMFWWVLHSIYVVPELMSQFAIWTLPGIIGLGLAGGLIFSIPFVVISRTPQNHAYRAILFATIWTLVLWLREWLFTGFPWNPIANITMQMPVLANSMSLWGALGLTFVVIGAIAMTVNLMLCPKCRKSWLGCGLFAGLLIVGSVVGYKNMQVSDAGADVSNIMIRVVQPAVSQTQKATHDRNAAMQNAELNLRTLVSLATVDGAPDLIIFPETAYPFVLTPDDEMPLARALNANIVIGATTFDGQGLYNSLVVADKNGKINKVYSKSHLVPFGEYKPLGFLPSPVNLARGNGPELLSVDGFVFAPAICYEIIFSDSLLPETQQRPNAIINITNDNWFGKTPGTYQHLDMVRRYAIESGLPIVRANYSGISAFVAADGTVVSWLPIGVSGALDGFVWGAHATPYQQIGMNWWMAIILLFAIVGLNLFRNRD